MGWKNGSGQPSVDSGTGQQRAAVAQLAVATSGSGCTLASVGAQILCGPPSQKGDGPDSVGAQHARRSLPLGGPSARIRGAHLSFQPVRGRSALSAGDLTACVGVGVYRIGGMAQVSRMKKPGVWPAAAGGMPSPGEAVRESCAPLLWAGSTSTVGEPPGSGLLFGF